jgi:hypothetical protein
MRGILLVAVLSVCVPAAAWAETATVPSGKKTQITIHSRFDSQCRPARVNITVRKAPANGTVTTEPQDYVVPERNRNGVKQFPQCVGKTMRGVAVFYESKPGFVGTDSFRYQRVNADKADDRFNQDVSYTITVK